MTTDFSAVPDTAVYLYNPLFNAKESWSDGAFNAAADPENGLDFGWGSYNVMTHEVEGTRVFVIKLRDLGPKKLQITNLSGGVYTFKFADLDGANEVTRSVAKSDHAGSTMAYFSFTTGEVVEDIEPETPWDLLYCRYTEYLDNPEGGDPIPYLLTGVLSGSGVQVAMADSVDPANVEFDDYRDSLSTDLNVIGHDWKEFDLNTFAWAVAEDRVYFVLTADGHIWKLQFIDFEGSSTGTTVFEKTDLGVLSSTLDPTAPLESYEVFPNPATDHVDVAFTLKDEHRGQTYIAVFDAMGQEVLNRKIGAVRGFNVVTMETNSLASGMYYVALKTEGQVFTKVLSVAR